MTKKAITRGTSGEELENSSAVSQQTENGKEEIKSTLETIPNVLDTMEFYMSDDNNFHKYGEALKEGLKKLNPNSLRNTKFVNLDLVKRGIDLALEKMLKNPEDKIILSSFMTIDYFSKRDGDKVKLLLSNPNVKFIRFPFHIQDLVNLFPIEESKEDVLKTITFKMRKGTAIEESMREELIKIDISGLKDTVFIDLIFRESEDQYLQDYHGIQVALDILQKNPEQKIIIFTPLNKEGTDKMVKIGNKSDKFNLIMSGKNVRAFEYGDDPKKLEHIFDTQEEQESNEDILKTVEFYEVNGRFPYLKEYFSTLDLAAFNLKNSIVVDLRADEKTYKNTGWDDMSGLRIANETLQKDPNAKIILCSLIPIDIFQKVIAGTKSEEYLKTLLQGKNVKLIQSAGGNSMTKEEVLKQFEGMYPQEEKSESTEGSKAFKQLAIIESETAFQKVLEQEISHFLHDGKYWLKDRGTKELEGLPYEDHLKWYFKQAQDKKSGERIAFENKLISLLQFQHASYKKVSRERNLGGILDTYKFIKQKVLPEGTRFEGVFVDRDGCLYNNDKKAFNPKVLEMIKDYQQQGKEVTLWTLGNVEIKQKLLDEAGLPYIVKSKIDYKGGTVELVIDDESQEKFYANTLVKAEKFVKI
ncbi:MAG: hypothetical protein NTY80_01935 [candidate division SR1 bacterium]|nr:hypothetical protein [candidate division SR1 bacterium]